MATAALAALISCSYLIPALAVVLALFLLRSRYNGLHRIPGPWLAALSNLWRLNDVRKGQAHTTAIALHRRYGKLVRIGPNVVSVGDPAAIPLIYNIKRDFTKTAFYPIQSLIWDKKAQMNLFSTRSETEHRKLRKKVASAYTLDSLLKMEPEIDDCSKLFLSKMGEYADRGEPVDLGKWLQYYSEGMPSFDPRHGTDRLCSFRCHRQTHI